LTWRDSCIQNQGLILDTDENTASVPADQFPNLLKRLPSGLILDALAEETQAIQRKRKIDSGAGLRWHIELAFKYLTSLPHMEKLPTRTERTSRSWHYARLLLTLNCDDGSQAFLDSSP